jgi:hypothetical protein
MMNKLHYLIELQNTVWHIAFGFTLVLLECNTADEIICISYVCRRTLHQWVGEIDPMFLVSK